MRFLSIFSTKRTGEPSAEEIAKTQAVFGEMAANGTLVDAGGHWPTGLSVRATHNGGKVSVTDGPFTESKEIVGGYAILKVRDREHLVEVAQRFLDSAGHGTWTMYELVEMNGD